LAGLDRRAVFELEDEPVIGERQRLDAVAERNRELKVSA
jgi:hypothetical protein